MQQGSFNNSKARPHCGVISSIKQNKRNQNRCSIFVEEKFSLSAPIEPVLSLALKVGGQLSDDHIDFLLSETRRSELLGKALRFATYKPRTLFQVREKLRLLKYEPAEQDRAVEYLTEFGYLDDVKYAQMFVRDAVVRGGKAEARIQFELMKRGIEKSLVQSTLESEFPTDLLPEMCLNVARKKLKMLGHKSPDKQKSSVIAYLQRQGFSWNVIKLAMVEIFEES